MKTLGQRIRQLRKDKKLGLRETARLIGISATFLSQVENEKATTTPSEKTLQKLTHTLDGSIDKLMHLAKRVPSDILKYLQDNPEVIKDLRAKIKKRGIKI